MTCGTHCQPPANVGAPLEDIADLPGHKELDDDQAIRTSRSEQTACGGVSDTSQSELTESVPQVVVQ